MAGIFTRHIAFRHGQPENLIANVADLLGSPASRYWLIPDITMPGSNLSGAPLKCEINHGYKAVQIAVSAWTAEALKNTMPASVFARSTECHNQDKVSMGTIAARDARRNLELTEQVAAATLLAARQGVWLRQQQGQVEMGAGLTQILTSLAQDYHPLTVDRAMEPELRRCVEQIRQQHWSLYA